jgi:hypothetical protein
MAAAGEAMRATSRLHTADAERREHRNKVVRQKDPGLAAEISVGDPASRTQQNGHQGQVMISRPSQRWGCPVEFDSVQLTLRLFKVEHDQLTLQGQFWRSQGSAIVNLM